LFSSFMLILNHIFYAYREQNFGNKNSLANKEINVLLKRFWCNKAYYAASQNTNL